MLRFVAVPYSQLVFSFAFCIIIWLTWIKYHGHDKKASTFLIFKINFSTRINNCYVFSRRKKRQTSNTTTTMNANSTAYYCIKKTVLGSTLRSCLPQVWLGTAHCLLLHQEDSARKHRTVLSAPGMVRYCPLPTTVLHQEDSTGEHCTVLSTPGMVRYCPLPTTASRRQC